MIYYTEEFREIEAESSAKNLVRFFILYSVRVCVHVRVCVCVCVCARARDGARFLLVMIFVSTNV